MSRARLRGAILALATLSCSGSDETTDAEPPSSEREATATSSALANEMCQLPSGGYTSDCNTCLAASCCEDIEACKANGECAAQLTCIIDCQQASDPGACSAACTEPGGVHVGYTAYDDCSFGECMSTCWL
jgi:hypothetical protein